MRPMRTSRARLLLVGLGFALALSPAAALANRYAIQPGAGSDVEFASRAPMEKFTGRTDQVSGWLDADLDDLSAPFTLEVAVDLASFDTGKSKRNQHMRENHLETDSFPTAVFKGGTLADNAVTSVPVGGAAVLTLAGTLDLHGVVRPMDCEVTVERPEAGLLQVTARFAVLLSDHAIERPSFLVMKLAEDQQVTARLVLREVPQ